LGSGQYGKVYKAYNSRKNNYFAVKVVKSSKFKEDPKLEEFTMNEIQALARIKNKNVIEFIEMIRTQNHYYFIYEFCNGGDLEGLLEKRGTLSE
jgi:serine/threonine protein kinase